MIAEKKITVICYMVISFVVTRAFLTLLVDRETGVVEGLFCLFLSS